jgi:hypothetical protein
LPTLTAAQEKKLKQLTVVSMAGKAHFIHHKNLTHTLVSADATTLSYAALQAATAIADVRELENLIISCITQAYFPAKCGLFLRFVCVVRSLKRFSTHLQLDQAQQALVVRGCSGRDVRPAELESMLAFMYV